MDEYTRECPVMLVRRRIISQDVIGQLYELFLLRGVPEHIRSDNGPEFTATAICKWLNSRLSNLFYYGSPFMYTL